MLHHLDETMDSIQKRITKDGRISYRALVRVKGCPMKSATFAKWSDAIKSGQEKESAFRLNRHFTLIVTIGDSTSIWGKTVTIS